MFNPLAKFSIWKRALEPLLAEDIGDQDGPDADSNLRQWLADRRKFRGNVADVAARDLLPALAVGEWVLVLDAGLGQPRIDVYYGPVTGWKFVQGYGGGGNGSLKPIGLGDGNAATKFYLPYSGDNELVFVETMPMYPDDGATVGDYAADTDGTGRYITFHQAVPVGQRVYASATVSTLAGTDANTLGGYGVDAGQAPNSIPVRNAAGKLPGTVNTQELWFWQLFIR